MPYAGSGYLYGTETLPVKPGAGDPALEPSPDSSGIGPTDFNKLESFRQSVQSHALAADYQGLADMSGGMPPVAPAGQVYLAANAGKPTMSRDGLPWANPQPFVHVTDYGADPTGLTDSLAAFVRARAEADALGGAYIVVPRGFYQLTGQFILSGEKWVDEKDIDIVNGDYSLVASFDAVKYAAALTKPINSLVLEPGAVLWGNFVAATQTALVYVGARSAEYEPSAVIENLSVVAKPGASISGGTFHYLSPSTAAAPSTNIGGVFWAGTRVDLQNFSSYVVDRPVLVSNAYWSRLEHVHCFHSGNALVLPGFNACSLKEVICSYARTTAVQVTGQGFQFLGLSTEECAIDLYMPQCDGALIEIRYIENISDTDYGIKLGDGTQQVLWLDLHIPHMSRTAGKSINAKKAQFSVFGSRIYDHAVDGDRVLLDNASNVAFFNCSIPINTASNVGSICNYSPGNFVSKSVLGVLAVPAGQAVVDTITATGARAGSPVQVSMAGIQAGFLPYAVCSTNDQVDVYLLNISGAPANWVTDTVGVYWYQGFRFGP